MIKHLNINSSRASVILLDALREQELRLTQDFAMSKQKQEEATKQVDRVAFDLSEVRNMIKELIEEHQVVPDKYFDYNPKSTWKERVEYLLEKNQRPMHNREMVDELIGIDPEIKKIEVESRQAIKSLSGAVTLLAEDKRIIRFGTGQSNDLFAALAGWFNKENENTVILKEEYAEKITSNKTRISVLLY